MNNLRTSFLKQSKLLKIVIIFLIISFLISFLIYKKIDNTITFDNLNNIGDILTTNHINYFIYHFIVISVLITSSLTIIGLILYILYFLFEWLSITYNLFTLVHVYHLKGLIYSIIYLIVTKAIFILLLILIFKKIVNTIKLVLFSKNNDFKYTIYKNIRRILTYIFLVFINDIFIYFFGNAILQKLLFIIN